MASVTEVTNLESHPNYDRGISKMAKKNARNADPNEGHCLVTNSNNTIGVEYCHCILRRIMKEEGIVCVYLLVFILSSNTYHSSIALNGTGT